MKQVVDTLFRCSGDGVFVCWERIRIEKYGRRSRRLVLTPPKSYKGASSASVSLSDTSCTVDEYGLLSAASFRAELSNH